MFSTILDKATSYFDRRTLVSAFFPSLVFWGITVLAFVTFQMDWASIPSAWDKLSITLQLVILLAFFVWVTFWSFLTSNFRMNYTRLFEGYWSEDMQPSAFWRKKRRTYWQNRWDKLNDQSRNLEDQITDLEQERDLCEELMNASAILQLARAGNAPGDSAQQEQALDKFLQQWKVRLNALPQAEDTFNKELQQLSQEFRGRWEQLNTLLAGGNLGNDAAWREREKKLREFGQQLTSKLKQQIAELEMRSLAISREMSLFYPPGRTRIMPTQLGNVLRAVEFYPWERYNLDAVVILPRLQQDLPEGFSSSMLDSKASFDLMVTLSAFILLFGVPFSVWGAVRATTVFPWWVSLILVLVALPLRLYYAAGVAGLTLVVSLLISPHVSPIDQLHTLIVALVGVLLLFRLTYQNAVGAAVDYGEKIKAAFDLYRWKVLENLHLQLPRSFKEERQVWEQVSQLLYHGDTPDPDYYRYILPEQGKETTTSSAKTKESAPAAKTEGK